MTYGFSELFWGLPRLEERNIGSPDFLRSGWTDLHSFTIADVFEAGFKILLIGPIAGAVLGGLGASLHARPTRPEDSAFLSACRCDGSRFAVPRYCGSRRMIASGIARTISAGPRQPTTLIGEPGR